MNNSCFIFDVDGTLTDARQPMDAEFETFFKSWMQDKNVYLVSGSDLEKIEEQVFVIPHHEEEKPSETT